ncbi:MAG: hypothetical protein QXF12_01295 [Candidatus Aenigmatarchaeota archaeon]
MPRPRKSEKETWKEYLRRLTQHYIKEGYMPNQAYAIANYMVKKMKNRKQ